MATYELDKEQLNEIENFCNSNKFAQFLLNNVTDLMSCAFILDTLFAKIKEAEEACNTEE